MSTFNSLGSNYSAGLVGRVFQPSSPRANSQLQDYLATRYGQKVQLTYKCREAITLGLRQLGLPAESFVAINGFTCYAVYEAIMAAGLRPYYLDITRKDLNFNVQTLEHALKTESNIRVVMIQNTFAIPVNITPLKKLCDAHKVVLVEDVAHAIGVHYPSGQEIGTVGEWAALSFSQDKMIDGVSGGALIGFKTDTVAPAPKRRALSVRLSARLYPLSTVIIRNTFTSGIGRVMLKGMKSLHMLPNPMDGSAAQVHYLPHWQAGETLRGYQGLPTALQHRQKIAAIYHERLPADVQFTYDPSAGYLRFPLYVDNRATLLRYLKRFHWYFVDTWYDAPIGPKSYLIKTDYTGQCPQAEDVAAHIVNLPTHRHVSEKQATEIAERIASWLKSK